MKYETENKKKGAVLLLTFVIVITLTLVTGAFLYMVSVGTKSTSVNSARGKAFWLAEAGVQDVIYRLNNDAGYRANPVDLNELLGSGNYAVTVAKQANKYAVVSIGTSGIVSRMVTASMTVGTKGSSVTITLEKDLSLIHI